MILLLDVMDTLVYDPFHHEVPALFDLSLERLLELKHPRAWQRFETGEWDEAKFGAEYFRDRRAVDLAAFRRTLSEAYRFLPGVEALLEELHAAGVVMHALSNYPPWYRLIEAKLKLSRFLRWSFVSCETGVRKPDPAAYLGAVQTLGATPSECLFVDDRRSNVEAAERAGLRGHHFEGAAGLRVALTALGVLPGPGC